MRTSRSLFVSCIVAFALVQLSVAADDHPFFAPRQQSNILSIPAGTTTAAADTATATTTTTDAAVTTTTPTSTSTTPTSTTPTSTSTTPTSTTLTSTSTTPTSTSTTPSTPTVTSTSPTATSTTPANTPTQTKANTSPTPTPTAVTTTNAEGEAVTVTITPSDTSSATSSAAAASSSAASDSDDDKGLSTGSIVGMSVAGGVALFGIIGFFVWKFTRKRFNDFNDNEAIKWPELNAHGEDSHPLPVNNTGRAGFDTQSELNLSRAPSASTGYATSTPDLNYPSGGPDPYAVPPLPYLNPNQPYHDDPSISTYYDPYRGPVPNTFNDAASMDVPHTPGGYGEAIPMTQMAGQRNPGPGMGMGMGGYDMGRSSPAPQMGGRMSPMPQAAGRQSPSPQAAYGMRTKSPGPGFGGRASPGPQAAYDPGYGPR